MMNGSISRFLPLMTRLVVYAYTINLFSYITADPDLWGHLKFGGEIWQTGQVHDTEPFSYTAPGYRWINHEWFTEVLYFLIYDSFDSTGLLLFKLTLGLGIVHLLSSLVSRQGVSAILYLGVFFLMLPVLAPGFMMRPHLMTLFCLTVLVVLLCKGLGDSPKWLYGVPPLMLLWVNSHGGVVAGMGIFGMAVVIELIRDRIQGNPFRSRLAMVLGLSMVAVLCNPYGYKLWEFFIQSLGASRSIGEWNPVPLAGLDFWQYKLLTLLFLITLFAPTKKRWWEVVAIALTLAYGYKHMRHTVLAVIFMTPYLVRQWTLILNRWSMPTISLTRDFYLALYLVLLTVIGFNLHQALFKYRSNQFKIMVEPNVYPTHLGRFMLNNGINGNLAVPFDWGEYFIWKLPDSRVSIDGRFRTAYPERVIKINQAFSSGRPAVWRWLLEAYPTDYVITRRGEGVHERMEREPDWVKIYQDPSSKLFIKKTDPPQAVLEKFYNRKLIIDETPVSYHFP